MAETVVIVGGGLAGLAAAVALAGRGLAVTLCESRGRFGGRASSFVDQASGESLDNCQHVALGCCTNFLHFSRTVGLDEQLCCEDRLTFLAREKGPSEFAASWWPAPFHLFPAFAGLKFLSWADKWRLALSLRELARADLARCANDTFLDWLKRHRQSPAAIERFWHVVLVSALSESLDRMGVAHARKVFVDGFLRHRDGWKVWIPTVPLDEFYGTRLLQWFAARHAVARTSSRVARVCAGPQPGSLSPDTPSVPDRTAQCVPEMRASGVELRSGEFIPAAHVILTVPPHLVGSLLPDAWRSQPEFSELSQLETAPISSVHLWYDRPITDLRHATFIERKCQWLFNRSAIQGSGVRSQESEVRGHHSPPTTHHSPLTNACHYYQIVISASRDVVERPQEATIRAVMAELAEIFPAARDARLVHSRLVTEHKAVLSMLPGIDARRPVQQTSIANLYLAGDWTNTGWPGTMEGAVRSGYLAAERVLHNCGRAEKVVQPDLPTAWLSQLFFGL